MKKALLLALALASASAFANELDREVKNAQRNHAGNLPRTLIVRKDTRTGSIAVMHSNKKIAAQAQEFNEQNFVQLNAKGSMRGGRTELDGDSSSSGWYFYWNNYSYYTPTYYYYGYNYSYQPYYNYYNPYNYCNYTYYNWK